MGIFRSNDPTTWDKVDQVVIAEIAPPGSISGVATNIAILVGRFERGPANELVEIGSTGELFETYGNNDNYSGNLELKNKKFGRLRIIRTIAATGAAKSTKSFDGATIPVIQFDAKFEGDYGDNIKVTIEDGTVSGKKYTVQDTNTNPAVPDEIYDNLAIADIVANTFAGSKLVDVTVLATSEEPTNVAATALASGSDGTEADTDYATALVAAEQESSGNFIWADKSSTTVKNALEQHVQNAPDKIAIICPDDDTVDEAAAVTDVANYRSDRIVYAYPYVATLINGVEVSQAPSSWYASIMSQMPPHKDPASIEAVQFTVGILKLKQQLTRADYITFKEQGISAYELDPLYGVKPKSGVVTGLTAGKTQILRRRMTDFLTTSIANRLKQWQNKVNNRANRDAVKAEILNFDKKLENEGILPSKADVKTGSPVAVDTESLNTDDLIALGYFKIQYVRRIYSSMRYIVLLAEIGEGVLVTEE